MRRENLNVKKSSLRYIMIRFSIAFIVLKSFHWIRKECQLPCVFLGLLKLSSCGKFHLNCKSWPLSVNRLESWPKWIDYTERER